MSSVSVSESFAFMSARITAADDCREILLGRTARRPSCQSQSPRPSPATDKLADILKFTLRSCNILTGKKTLHRNFTRRFSTLPKTHRAHGQPRDTSSTGMSWNSFVLIIVDFRWNGASCKDKHTPPSTVDRRSDSIPQQWSLLPFVNQTRRGTFQQIVETGLRNRTVSPQKRSLRKAFGNCQ